MAEIRTILHTDGGRMIIGEDPYSTFSRIFIDTYAFDLTTLTPSLNKQFQYQNLGNSSLSYFTYGSDSPYSNTGGSVLQPITQTYYQHQLGIMALQKQTITCYGPNYGSIGPFAPIGGFDTFHCTMDFVNYPLSRWQKLAANNSAVLLNGANYIATNSTGASYFNQYAGPTLTSTTPIDITTATPPNVNFSGLLSRIHWEDSANGVVWGVYHNSSQNPNFRSYYGNTYTSAWTLGQSHAGSGNNNSQIFFMGVDNANAVYWVETHDWALGTPYHVYKCTPNTAAYANSYPLIANAVPFRANASSNTHAWRRNYPSNIRRDSSNVNRYVFYSSHYDNGTAANTVGDVNANLAPLRFTFDVNAGNVYYDQCNVAYPGSNGYASYAQAMINVYATYTDITYNGNPWTMKPYQFVSNGNNYITFWFCDTSAGSYNNTAAGTRWRNANTRTMMTYTMGQGQSDNVLTFHSSYTFPTLFDIPWNYMPINPANTGPYSNSTLMVVPSTGKTGFMKWNDANGWSTAAVYPVESRGIGIDSTNRMWIISMEKNNGVIHILSNTIPVNVSVVLANTGPLTYTGNVISTYALVNAYNYGGDRVAANVTLSINGSTMLIANNSGKQYTLTTSNTVDTTVALTISGGGLNNMFATISV